MSLARVTLTTQTLNVYDRGGAGAPSAISIADSRITATGPGSGLLLELDDAADRIAVAGTTLDAPAGVMVRAAGTRDGDNRGGTVQIARSTIRSTVAESAGVTVIAAETGGVVALAETGIVTPGDVTVLADRCNATLRGKVLDCSVAALTRQLAG
ncbi:hypothetical protein [Actinomycetospora soli]|uniref:hypothetical protein n=1 Tax=Actinomycetospora soli TaxID=2893887 RepID=UPI001E516D43|nr:hypothetical protein [Actinomycetospora soli]MCD2187843.1 hypothetical protein [Actinomycetospora soli]